MHEQSFAVIAATFVDSLCCLDWIGVIVDQLGLRGDSKGTLACHPGPGYHLPGELLMNRRKKDIMLVSLAIMFCAAAYFLLDLFFDFKGADLSIEVIAAILGAALTVVAMALLIGLQTRAETKKEFQALMYSKKLAIYQDLVDFIFKMDDDKVRTEEEVGELENRVGLACLVAEDSLVRVLGLFAWQFKIFGCIFFKRLDEQHYPLYVDQYNQTFSTKISVSSLADHFISIDEILKAIRSDLSLSGGLNNPFQESKIIDLFTSVRYNQNGFFRDPNRVD